MRSSITRRLGLKTAGLPRIEKNADGQVEVLLDATTNCNKSLTASRLKAWQAALFPTGYSGMQQIPVGKWRKTASPMQVVSGPIGHERVHFEAPTSKNVPSEIRQFLLWWAKSRSVEDGLIRAAKAHLWFVTIHPFEDGNGRIARTLIDMALAQDEETKIRCYSISAQIQATRDSYYEILEKTQKGKGDITDWLIWFLETFSAAIARSEKELERIFAKARFWQRRETTGLNPRQLKALNRLFDAWPDEFFGGLTTKKYAHLTKTSPATAKREILDMRERGLLKQRAHTAGRNVSYYLMIK